MREKIHFIDRDIIRKKDLLLLLTKKEVTLKYRRTVLGILWSLLNPIILALVLFVAFTIFLRFHIQNYTFFLLSALFPWTWFSTSVNMASGSLIWNFQLLKKVRFPKHFLVLSTVLTQLINFLFSLPIITALAFFYGQGPHIIWLLGIPILIVLQFILTIGISLMVSILNAYFRDMEYIITVFINLLFWMTPIVYSLDMVPAVYRVYLAINPLTYLITAWRDIFMSSAIVWFNIGISWLVSLVFLFFGVLMFRKLGERLDEVI